MLGLIGEYECTLDSKNRLMIPADFRGELKRSAAAAGAAGPASLRWCVTLYYQNRLRLMPEDEFNRQASKIKPTLLPKDEQVVFLRELYKRTRVVEPDQQGRVVLPEKLLAPAQLGRDVMLLGMGRYIEVFTRQESAAASGQDNFDDLFRKARDAGIEME